jgi:malic enzyme
VAVVPKGMAGRELRDVEPLAATALMARTATLFKRLADIDTFELEFDAVTSEVLVECVTALSGTIGGIDLGGAMKILGCMDVERRHRSNGTACAELLCAAGLDNSQVLLV